MQASVVPVSMQVCIVPRLTVSDATILFIFQQ